MKVNEGEVARANLDNLTALWRAMGTFPVSGGGPPLAYRKLSWPRRCWFDTQSCLPTKNQVAEIITSLPPGYIVPVWEGPLERDLSRLLAREGYEISFHQTAMALSLAEYPVADETAATLKDTKQIELQRVGSTDAIRAWCDVGESAFDYHIDPESLSRALGTPGLELYLARVEGGAVATCLMFQTGEIAGIHQVGVPPAHRGRGIARALMHLLLARSIERGATFMTLQASVEGEPLYRSMGFDAYFSISNYTRS